MRRLSAPLDFERAGLAGDQPNFVVAIYMLIRTGLPLWHAIFANECVISIKTFCDADARPVDNSSMNVQRSSVSEAHREPIACPRLSTLPPSDPLPTIDHPATSLGPRCAIAIRPSGIFFQKPKAS
jgi:hypothetical protein